SAATLLPRPGDALVDVAHVAVLDRPEALALPEARARDVRRGEVQRDVLVPLRARPVDARLQHRGADAAAARVLGDDALVEVDRLLRRDQARDPARRHERVHRDRHAVAIRDEVRVRLGLREQRALELMAPRLRLAQERHEDRRPAVVHRKLIVQREDHLRVLGRRRMHFDAGRALARDRLHAADRRRQRAPEAERCPRLVQHRIAGGDVHEVVEETAPHEVVRQRGVHRARGVERHVLARGVPGVADRSGARGEKARDHARRVEQVRRHDHEADRLALRPRDDADRPLFVELGRDQLAARRRVLVARGEQRLARAVALLAPGKQRRRGVEVAAAVERIDADPHSAAMIPEGTREGPMGTGTHDDIAWMPATEMAQAVRDRRLSPVEVTDALLARIEALNPALNAYCLVTPEMARAQAKAAEAAVMRGDALGPLHGVPLSIKDLFDVQGLPTTKGSKIYRDRIAEGYEFSAKRLLDAGGVHLGKTNTPEFGMLPTTENLLFGATYNPWDLRRTPGGSSGGAASAVAAGLGPLALGSDGGGSIRIPASLCGIFGLKPTYGRVPR